MLSWGLRIKFPHHCCEPWRNGNGGGYEWAMSGLEQVLWQDLLKHWSQELHCDDLSTNLSRPGHMTASSLHGERWTLAGIRRGGCCWHGDLNLPNTFGPIESLWGHLIWIPGFEICQWKKGWMVKNTNSDCDSSPAWHGWIWGGRMHGIDGCCNCSCGCCNWGCCNWGCWRWGCCNCGCCSGAGISWGCWSCGCCSCACCSFGEIGAPVANLPFKSWRSNHNHLDFLACLIAQVAVAFDGQLPQLLLLAYLSLRIRSPTDSNRWSHASCAALPGQNCSSSDLKQLLMLKACQNEYEPTSFLLSVEIESFRMLRSHKEKLACNRGRCHCRQLQLHWWWRSPCNSLMYSTLSAKAMSSKKWSGQLEVWKCCKLFWSKQNVSDFKCIYTNSFARQGCLLDPIT